MSKRPSGCSQVLTCHQASVLLLSSTGPKDRSVYGVMSDDQRVFKRVEELHRNYGARSYATKWGKGKRPSESETGFKAPRDTQSLGICWMRDHRQAGGCFWVARSTTWAVLNQDKRAGPSAKVIKRILSSPNLPQRARRKVEEYVEEKICGRYGHSERSAYAFRVVFCGG